MRIVLRMPTGMRGWGLVKGVKKKGIRVVCAEKRQGGRKEGEASEDEDSGNMSREDAKVDSPPHPRKTFQRWTLWQPSEGPKPVWRSSTHAAQCVALKCLNASCGESKMLDCVRTRTTRRWTRTAGDKVGETVSRLLQRF